MIELHIDSPIAAIILDRPPVNAINDGWMDEMNRALDAIEMNRDVPTVHIRSALKTFCAGADLALMDEHLTTPQGRDSMIEVVRRIQRTFARIERLDAVTVAAIGGAALGGGLEFALACDLRIAAEEAKIGLPESGLGLLPGAGGTQRLPHLCGAAVAKRLIFGGEIIDGREARRLGIVQWAVPRDTLSAQAEALVANLASVPPQALIACKRCIGAAFDGSVDGFERELTETRRLHDLPATQQRIRTFLAKRA